MGSNTSIAVDSRNRPHISELGDWKFSGNVKYYGKYTVMVDIWRGTDNPLATDGDEVSSCLLTGSTVQETYEEHNNSTLATTIPQNGCGEWDWVIKNFSASAGTYYFRMAYSGGAEFDDYENYPQLTVGAAKPGKARIYHWEEVR